MLSLAKRFQFFAEMFALRPDVEMTDFELLAGEGIGDDVRKEFEDQLPGDLLAFYEVFNGFEFMYEIPENEGDTGNHGIRLARLQPGNAQSKWWDSRGYEAIEFESSFAIVDRPDEEWKLEYIHQEGDDKRDAKIAYHGPIPEDTTWWESFEDYLTEGAKHAFLWFWELEGDNGRGGSLSYLLDNSVDPGLSHEELAQLLLEQNQKLPEMLREGLELEMTEEVAEELIDWLGDRVVLLLPTE